MSEQPQPHDPGLRPEHWPDDLQRHTLVLRGNNGDRDIPIAITFEYPAHLGMAPVRALRDYGHSLGLQLMQDLYQRGDESVRDAVHIAAREQHEQAGGGQ